MALRGSGSDHQRHAGKPRRVLRLESVRETRSRAEPVRTNSSPSSAEASASDRATLLPSPTKTSFLPGQRSPLLQDGHHVGHRLTRVRAVRQGIDHRDRRMAGQLLDDRLGKRADGQDIDILADHPGEIRDAFADPQSHVLPPEEDGISPQPGHCRSKLTRVRNDGFSKIRPSVRPSSSEVR